MPSVDVLDYYDGPPAIIRDKVRADDVHIESEAETRDKQIDVREKTIYDDLIDFKGAMFEMNRQAQILGYFCNRIYRRKD